MRKIAIIAVLICLSFPLLLIGQGETSNWYFGDGAGVSFNADGSVTALSNGRLDTFEGCATISDSSGNLLFYTDGITVYNQDHLVMDNGNGLFGDPSSTQSAIIVPKPGDFDTFFVFTVDTSTSEFDPDRGLNYSIVDMSMNDGKGSVVQKNVRMLADCSEKIAAVVKNCSDQSFWLLTLAPSDTTDFTFNTFHAFEINDTGVVLRSVKTTFEGLNIQDPRGYLKVSPDGSKLASANMRGGLFVYDFDTTTGIPSNQERVFISGSNKAAYGIEFSPNNRYLYAHVSNDLPVGDLNHQSSLVQYDMLAANIQGSQEILDSRPVYRGALQLADNGKIYRTTAEDYFVGTPFLSVINNPNEKGDAAGYEHDAISLNGENATQGLPPFIQSFFNKIEILTNEDGSSSSSKELCAGEGFTLRAENIPGATYSWERDGIELSNATNVLQVLSAIENDSGKYRLSVTTGDPASCPIIGEALISVNPLPFAGNLVIEQCDVDNNNLDGITQVDLQQVADDETLEFTFYETDVDRTNSNSITNPERYSNTQAFNQTIFYKVTNEKGCENFGELVLQISPTTIVINPTSPILVCDTDADDDILLGMFDLEEIRQNSYAGLDVTFYANLNDATLEQNELQDNHSTETTTIYVRLEDDNQCLGVEQLELVVNPLPEFTLEESYLVCTDGEALVVNAPGGFQSYTWYSANANTFQEIDSSEQLAISEPGNYRLEVGTLYQQNGNSKWCLTPFDFMVYPSNRATFVDILIAELSSDNTVEIIVMGDGDYEYSLDGDSYQDEHVFQNIAAGFYSVFVRDKNGCGISERDISVLGYPKFFSPNADGKNDTWQIIGAIEGKIIESISIFDRYGKLVYVLSPDGLGWDGMYNGEPLPASDYWFKIPLAEGGEFKGHFALKR